MKTKQPVYDSIESIDDERILVSHIPVTMGEDVIGGICTLREVSRVIQAENSIRRMMHKGLVARYVIDDLIHKTRIMKDLVETTRLYAKTDSTVLVMGETGTGKEVLVQSLHNMSRRKAHRFMSVNCAALPEQLLESEPIRSTRKELLPDRKKAASPAVSSWPTTARCFWMKSTPHPPRFKSGCYALLQEREVMAYRPETGKFR